MATTFQQAWQKVLREGDIYNSTLFATSIYASRQKNTLPKRSTTTYKTRYNPTPNATIWPEYRGHHQLYHTGYSPILMEKQSRYAQSVFHAAESTLARLKEKW